MDRIEKIHLLTKRLIIMTALTVLLFAALFGISFLFEKRFMRGLLTFTVCFLQLFVCQRYNAERGWCS